MAQAQTKIRNLLLRCLVLLWINGCHGNFCLLSSTDCSQPGAPCTIVRDQDCKFAASDTQAEHYPGPVTSFDVITNYVKLSKKKVKPLSQSNVIMKWNLPKNGTYRYLSGFEVRVRDTNRSDPYCFIYSITNSTWNFATARKQYTLNCQSLAEGDYHVEVTSLPKTASSRMKARASIYIKHKFADDGRACPRNSCWVSDLVVYNQPCHHQLTVSFNMAPSDGKINFYTVSLLKPDSLYVISKQLVQHDEHAKRAVVTLNVSRPLSRAVIKLIPGGPACINGGCTVTKSTPFTIPDVDYAVDCVFDPPSVSVTGYEPRGEERSALWAIVLGSVLGAATLVTVTVALARSTKDRWRGRLRPRGATKDAFRRKKVYLLYANDDKYHRDVIGCFKQYLARHCCCDVIYDMEHQDTIPNDKAGWIANAMKSSDFILFVNSEGTYRRAVDWLGGLRHRTTDYNSCLGDMFTPAFQLLADDGGPAMDSKLILAHFSYTAPEFRSPPLAGAERKKNYRLMADVGSLCEHLHRFGGPSAFRCPSDVSELCYENTAEGQQLARSIDNCAAHVRSRPDRFAGVHGPPSPPSFVGTARERWPIPNDFGAQTEIRAPNPLLMSAIDNMSMDSSALGEMVAGLNR